MSDIVISAEGIGKKYKIGHKKSGNFRESINDLFKRINHFAKNKENASGSYFWALKDISFEVKKGDSVGIIGRNGAGKSTLLKILSRITRPTKGRFWIEGRVSSLLEVGTGFHPELTGRENIFLNGTILGMKRHEIRNKLDEIVSFSGVDEFLDTPVKRYSSGMIVRLAFSVAAHLEPEILIIDEVLAVGDAEFQKKCLGKMEDVTGEGRTVLFVSHNMAAVSNLCNKTIFLRDGQIVLYTDSKTSINRYLDYSFNLNKISLLERTDRKGNGLLRFEKVEILNRNTKTETILSGDDITFRFFFQKETGREYRNFRLDVGLNNLYNERIAWMSTELTSEFDPKLDSPVNYIDLSIPRFPFNAGRYSLTLYATVNGAIADWIQNAFYFDVEAGDFFGNGKKPIERQGYFLINHSFTIA